MKRSFALFFIAMLACACSLGAPEPIALYSGSIPNSRPATDEERLRDPAEPYAFYLNISRPQIYAYPLGDAPNSRAAIVILPGGSYRGVSLVKEGFEVAEQLNAFGIAAFVVKYRTPSDAHMLDKKIGPLQDAQQALKLVRERAREWNVDPARVGLMGFSAGGHLAAMASTRFARPVLPGATAEQVRPDFLILAYPVISFEDAITHRVSREMLLGSVTTRELIEKYSIERHVTAQTPPTFLMHAADDRSVPVANSLRFFEALQAAKVPSQLIVYPAGGHGFGLKNTTTPDRWIERIRDWLLSSGYLRSSEMPNSALDAR